MQEEYIEDIFHTFEFNTYQKKSRGNKSDTKPKQTDLQPSLVYHDLNLQEIDDRQKEDIREQNREPQIIDSKIKKTQQSKKNQSTKQAKKQQGLQIIQEQQFKYIWNVLRQKQDSKTVTLLDLTKACQVYMKQQQSQEVLLEMLNIMNEDMLQAEEINHSKLPKSIDEESLRNVFLNCKLKL